MKDYISVDGVATALLLIEEQDRAAVVERRRLAEAHARLRTVIMALAPCLSDRYADDLATITARQIAEEERLADEVDAEVAAVKAETP